MRQLTFSVAFIFLSTAVLLAKATSTCSCSCGGHDEVTKKVEKKEKNSVPNVKQCTFQNLNERRNKGQIQTCDFQKAHSNSVLRLTYYVSQTCDFQKAHSNSALRLTYQGGMRLVSCSNGKCCRRWFITMNGKECSSPAPIDAVIYAGGVNGVDTHRPGTLDGFCNNIPKGRVTVGLSVDKCKNWSHDVGNAFTCWNSVCRFIIEEIPSLQ